MARARNIKPGFFTNDQLVEMPFEVRLLFIGLWTLADKAGRLKDRPKKIKMEIFPADNVDCEHSLSLLAKHGFLCRYEVDGNRYIQIINWDKHQNPHTKETDSVIPEIPVQAPEIPVRAGLIPDSGFLIPDSGYLTNPNGLVTPLVEINSKPPKNKTPVLIKTTIETELQIACRETWEAYSSAYTERYGTEPVRNAKVNAQIKQFVQRIRARESPRVAASYVANNSAYYVKKMHSVGVLLADAEKLRTEWATNKRVTDTEARQADKTQALGGVFHELIEEAKKRDAAA